jgi:RecA/RadA recombinase
MKSRSKPTPSSKKAPKKEAPTNPVEAGTIPPPAPLVKTGFRALSGKMPEGWGKASDVLDRVRAVPTIFPHFNKATRVGGLPVRRITTVHGPTHGGKTAAIGGFIRSFIEQDHAASYIDAEHATDLKWVDEFLGRPASEFPNFFAERPKTYEETIDKVDTFLGWMVAERKARFEYWREHLKLKKDAKLPPLPPELDLAGLMIVDSLNKLVPERELKKLQAEGGDAIDKGWGRYRAAMNQAWLDHIVPMLGAAETAFVIIVQERDADDLKPWEQPTLKGGAASQYDASLIIRVMKGRAIELGEGASKKVFGFAHRMRIWKSKVGMMETDHTDATFHMSNGKLVPEGFDTARDAILVGKELGIIDLAGSWYTWRKKRWNGDHNAVAALTKDREALTALLAEINTKIGAL